MENRLAKNQKGILKEEMNKIEIPPEKDIEAVKGMTKKTMLDIGKGVLSLATKGISDIFLPLASSEKEWQRAIEEYRLEMVIEKFVYMSKNAEKKIEKLEECLHNPYAYFLLKDVYNMTNGSYDETNYENVAKIMNMICNEVEREEQSGKKFSNNSQSYYDYVNFLSFAKNLSPYSLRIVMDIPFKRFKSNGSYHGSTQQLYWDFIDKYYAELSKRNPNGFLYGIWDLVDLGYLEFHDEKNGYYSVSHNTKAKYLNRLISQKHRN